MKKVTDWEHAAEWVQAHELFNELEWKHRNFIGSLMYGYHSISPISMKQAQYLLGLMTALKRMVEALGEARS